MAIPSFARPSTATVASTATSISVVEKLKGWRPRFFMLMTLFIAASSVTVGVLGWRLTLDAAKNNIEDLVQQIQDLVSNRITSYIIDEGSRLSDFVALQQDLFRNNVLSAATPERRNRTLQTMLSLLNRNRQTSVDVFYVTYPAGEITGYTYNSTGDLQMWTQQGLTVTTWTCDSDGIPVGNPYSVVTDVRDGTPQNPGNNRLLNWGPGGAAKVDLDYSSDNDTGISVTYPWNGRLFKTTVGLTVNKVTGEKVIVGGDWTMTLLSQQLDNINAAIPYPLFIGIFGTSAGNLIASSPKVINLSADKTRMLGLHEMNNSFVHDFDGYLNATYGNGLSVQEQLNLLRDKLHEFQATNKKLYVIRSLRGEDWILQLSLIEYSNQVFVQVTYLDIAAFQKEVQSTSDKTGYTMLGIIVAFVVLGCLFAIVITRQLGVVARQIDMLKNLKFSEVLDKDSGVKSRSFVFELAKLQEAFHEMVTVFAKTLKTSQGLQRGPQVHGGAVGTGSVNSIQASQNLNVGTGSKRETGSVV